MAAPSIVQSIDARVASGDLSVAFGSNVSPGNLIVVLACQYNGDVAFGSCSDTLSNTYTSRLNYVSTSIYCGVAIFTAPISSGGACTVTLSTSGMNSDAYYFCILEVSGADASPLDQCNYTLNTWTNALAADLDSTTFAEDLILAIIYVAGTSAMTWTPDSGYSEVQSNISNAPGAIVISRATSSIGNYDPGATASRSNPMIAGGIALKGVSSSSGNPWYYYAQQLRSLKDKWRGLLTIPSLAEVKLYGRTKYA